MKTIEISDGAFAILEKLATAENRTPAELAEELIKIESILKRP